MSGQLQAPAALPPGKDNWKIENMSEGQEDTA
jgi:hypothetical protein